MQTMSKKLTAIAYSNLLKKAACFVLVLPFASSAETFSIIESKPISEVWLNPGMITYHVSNNSELNGTNYGIGGEYRYSTVSSITLGVFNNSFRHTSHYVGWYWQPLELGSARIGAAVGAINGYPQHRDGSWFFSLIPTASIEYRNVGAALMYMPPHIKTSGAISFQLRFKVF